MEELSNLGQKSELHIKTQKTMCTFSMDFGEYKILISLCSGNFNKKSTYASL